MEGRIDVSARTDRLILCSICHKPIVGYGNFAWPYMEGSDAICCDRCNEAYVLPARLRLLYSRSFAETAESE